MMTRDAGDILRHRDKLEALLGLRLFNPDTDWDAFVAFVENDERAARQSFLS